MTYAIVSCAILAFLSGGNLVYAVDRGHAINWVAFIVTGCGSFLWAVYILQAAP